jgi:hypothetical protein
MMKIRIAAILVTVVIFAGIGNINAEIFSDGQLHVVDYQIPDNLFVSDSLAEEYTTVDLLRYGWINGFVETYDDSHFNFIGGVIGGPYLNSYNNSHINMQSGAIQGSLVAMDNSIVNISHGLIYGELYAQDNSEVFLSGGWAGNIIAEGENCRIEITGGGAAEILNARMQSQVTIYGSDFSIDGISVGYGVIPEAEHPWARILEGLYPNGYGIEMEFSFDTGASIILAPVPEPATLLLFGLGGLMLRKRRR